MIVISDTSIITNLAAIQYLQLLPQLYDRVTIPAAVYRELTEIDPPVPGEPLKLKSLLGLKSGKYSIVPLLNVFRSK